MATGLKYRALQQACCARQHGHHWPKLLFLGLHAGAQIFFVTASFRGAPLLVSLHALWRGK